MNYLELAKELAYAAGKIMLKAENLEIKEKSQADFVTNIDTEIEALVRKSLSEQTPYFGILGEEGAGEQSTWQEQLEKEYCWVLDPLDGTANFAFGIPHYAFSLALMHNKQPILGVVYDPILDELFFAEKGKGAFLNQAKIEVNKKDNSKNSIIAIGLASTSEEYLEQNKYWFEKILSNYGKIRSLGASALDLAWLASGRIDAFFQVRIKPWDLAAAAVICQEAGAKMISIEGNKKTEFDIQKGSIFCSNPNLFESFFNSVN